MRWEDESYVRLYKRDTLTWKRMGFRGQCAFGLILRKLDRAGLMALDGYGLDGVAAVLDHEDESEFICSGVEKLLELGVVRLVGEGEQQALFMPNFMAAQEAKSSDKARQQKCREVARDRAAAGQLLNPPNSEAVTGRDESSPSAVLSLAVPPPLTVVAVPAPTTGTEGLGEVEATTPAPGLTPEQLDAAIAARVAASSYLRGERLGRRGTPFKPSKAWFDANLERVLSGEFDDFKPAPVTGAMRNRAVRAAAMERREKAPAAPKPPKPALTEAQRLWMGVCESLRADGAVNAAQTLGSELGVELTDGVLTVRYRDRFLVSWVEDYFRKLVEDVLGEGGPKVRFTAEPLAKGFAA